VQSDINSRKLQDVPLVPHSVLCTLLSGRGAQSKHSRHTVQDNSVSP
jgi:hypothetical protein